VAERKQKLRGATKPRLQNTPLKGKSKLEDVIAVANILGEKLLPYQEYVLKDMLTVDKKDMFIRKLNLILISRQNGKTFLARMLILTHLVKWNTDVLIMSSNRSMALETFRQVTNALEGNDHLKGMVKQIRHANGTESVEMLSGARLDVVAATRDGSRGRSINGLLYIDEVREISPDGYRAAIPVTRAHANSMTLLTSNAGDFFSEVLNDLRSRALENPPKSFGFYEYSAPQYCKITDRQGWVQANPALGYTITEEALEEAVATSPIENTRTELLCQWISSLQSPFPPNSIEDCSDSSLQMSAGAYTVFAFDKSPSSRDAALVAGQILPDGKIGIGVLQTWESLVSVDELMIAKDIKAWADIYRPRQILHDKYATQTIADRLTAAGQICQDISGAQFYQACSDLLDATVNQKWVHAGQDLLITQFSNVAAKTNDSSWRIVKRQSAGSVAIPISVAMTISQLLKPQQVAAIYTE
jgi:phage terminase large subunit-like protein